MLGYTRKSKNHFLKLHLGASLKLSLFVIVCSVYIIVASSSSTYAAQLNLSISTDTLTANLPATSAGHFAESEKANIQVSTDYYNGYKLLISAVDGSALKDVNSSSNVINSISSSVSQSDFASSSTYNNQWGYKPSKYFDQATSQIIANSTEFLPAPSDTGDVLDITNAPNSTANTYTLSFATRIDTNQPTGTYENTFRVAVLGNPSPYTVNYHANAGTDTVEGMPSPNPDSGSTYDDSFLLSSAIPTRDELSFVAWCDNATSQTSCDGTTYEAGTYHPIDVTSATNSFDLYAIWESSCPAGAICYHSNGASSTGTIENQVVSDYGAPLEESEGDEVTLLSPNFYRTGYGFAGWNTKDDYSGDYYGPNQTILAPDTTIKGLNLYAVWIQSSGNLQNWDSCSSLTPVAYDTDSGTLSGGPSSVTALTDTRDNQTYAVARLADGNCWMIENLRLDNTPTLTASNTNNPSLPLTNNDSSTSNKLSATSSTWCATQDSACEDHSELNTLNTASNVSSLEDRNQHTFTYGNYYNWYSATAGHGTNAVVTGSVSGDVCPIGWQLPKGNENVAKSFSALDLAMGGRGFSQTGTNGLKQSALWRSFPNNYLYSGFIDSEDTTNIPSSRGRFGYYWTSTAYENDYNLDLVDFLQVGMSALRPGTQGSYKYDGFSIRCILGGN